MALRSRIGVMMSMVPDTPSFSAAASATKVDVVIVGAGLAGLTAAYRLRAAGKALVVLEGSDEVGGRARSRPLAGAVAELGGEWVGRRHANLMALMRELDIQSRPARQISYPILWRDGSGARLLVPRAPARELAAFPRVLTAASRLARTLDPVEPWRSENAAKLDRISFGEWLRASGIREEGYYFFDRLLGALSGAPIDRLSLLHVLWWVRRGGGPLGIVWTTFERNIPGGAQGIARALAARLDGRVVLGAPVTAIAQDSNGVELRTAAEGSYRASHAVVTAPLGTLGRITFEPPLPGELAALDQLSIAPGTKVIAQLPADRLPLHRVFVGGEVLAGGWRVKTRVTGFAPSRAGGATDGELLTDLAQGFGVAPRELRSPMVYRWSQHPFIPGCDIAFAPEELTRHGPHLRQAHGRVHFAATERSSWPNNMEGAVESATQVAQQLCAA